jgi:hypothetical protein
MRFPSFMSSALVKSWVHSGWTLLTLLEEDAQVASVGQRIVLDYTLVGIFQGLPHVGERLPGEQPVLVLS